MLSSFLTLCVVTCFMHATAEHVPSVKGMQWLSITCDTEEKLAIVLQFEKDRDFDFMTITRLPHGNVEVTITDSKVDKFKKLLEFHGIEYKVYIEDVQNLVDEEQKVAGRRRRRSPINFTLPYSFDYFPRHAVINNYLQKMTEKYEDVSLIDIGSSYESRKMYGVKISNNETNKTKPAILIDAGIHAREWISLTTALFTIKELVEESNKHLYKNVDWYIIPSVNPDGYEFSHTQYRLWRKTRSVNPNSSCRGVDGNRNYGYKWMDSTEETNLRVSDNPCKNTYAGNEPFSEIETQNMRDFVLSRNGTIKLYVNLHSTSQNTKYIVLPWSFTRKFPSNYSIMLDLAEKSASAIFALHGSNYTVGAASHIYYISPGTSIDWFLGTAKSYLNYAIELPSQDFIISEDKIENIGLEIFEAFKVFEKYVEDNYV